ncbi:hypothetical protein K438DRAFT_701570 [Mycena galopus ATCC 62051]|nr:hypothetical protein K438DRAFT_701570 [Mycena galopus ATCC 62051]
MESSVVGAPSDLAGTQTRPFAMPAQLTCCPETTPQETRKPKLFSYINLVNRQSDAHRPETQTQATSFSQNDLTTIKNNLGIGGCLVSIHEPAEAASWMENNWNDPLLTSIRRKGCGGPFAWMLSPTEPALAIFGHHNDPVIVQMAESLADLSRFSVVIRPANDNPALTLLTRDPDLHRASVDVGIDNDEGRRNADEGSSEESGNSGRRDSDLNDSAPISPSLQTENENQPTRDGYHGSDGGDGGGGEEPNIMVDDQWDSPLHRTRVKLRLKISQAHTYSVAIGHTFKFTINGKTEIPIDPDDLTRPLSRSEVIAMVDFEIETRPRETQVDRSYASIGFVSHRRESIIQRNL